MFTECGIEVNGRTVAHGVADEGQWKVGTFEEHPRLLQAALGDELIESLAGFFPKTADELGSRQANPTRHDILR